jgi:hypothetical protein
MTTKSLSVRCLIALSAFVVPVCFGNPVEVAVEPVPSHMEDAVVTTSFQTALENPDSEHAWVEVSLYESDGFDQRGETRIIREQVPGLKYDPESHQVVYEAEGKSRVVCAREVDHGFLFFHSKSIEATGNCKLNSEQLPGSPRIPASKQSDGFTSNYRPVLKVTLAIKG